MPETASPAGGWLRRLVPGMLIAATGVGAGDLATSALAGSRFGLSLVWALVLGAALKWVLNEGLARWQVGSGETLLEAATRRLRAHWIFVPYLLIWSFAVAGTLASACGVAALALVPLTGDPSADKRWWGAAHALAGWLIVQRGGFRAFERAMGAAIGLMCVTTIACAAAMAPQLDLSALRWSSPWSLRGEALRWTIGLIGGVGGTVTLLSYGYWIRENRAAGDATVRGCRIDLAVAYSVTALFGVAMIVIAAGTPELAGSGASLLIVLSDRLASELGAVMKYAFLLGAWGAVFTSLLGVWQGAPYLLADMVRAAGRGERGRARGPVDLTSTRTYRAHLAFLAVPPLVLLWRPFEVVQLTYAIVGAMFLPMLAVALLVMNNRPSWLPAEFRNGIVANAALLLTLGFFLWQGAIAIGETLAGRPVSS